MTGRVMIVTGANSGIGYEVARYLCEGGNDVVLACRDQDKGEAAVASIKAELPNSLAEFMELDLSSTTSVRSFVDSFVTKKRKLSLLVNNAAVALDFKDQTLRKTAEGHEVTMATNHLGPFLLTNLLLDYMIQTANILGDGRIVNISCGLHDHENSWQARGLDFIDTGNFQLEKEGTFNGRQAYKNSKLCNVLMTYSLAERLKSTNVSANAVDPGYVPKTELKRHSSQWKQCLSVCCLHNALRCTHITNTVKQAALEVCNVALGDKYEGKTGKYFKKGVEDRSSVESYDKDLQREVWKKSYKLVGLRTSLDDDFDDTSLGADTPLLKQRTLDV